MIPIMPETPSGKEDTADDMYIVDDSMPRHFEHNEKPAAEHHENASAQNSAQQIAKKTTVQKKAAAKKLAQKSTKEKEMEDKEKDNKEEKKETIREESHVSHKTAQQLQELKSEKLTQPLGPVQPAKPKKLKHIKYDRTSKQAKKENGAHQQKKKNTIKKVHERITKSSMPSKHSTPSKFKTILWVVAIIAIIGVLLFVKSRESMPVAKIPSDEETTKQMPKTPTAPIIEKEQYDDEAVTLPEKKTLGESVVAQESLKHLDSIDVTENPELFSNLKCVRDAVSGLRYISLRLYNTLQEDIRISHVGVAKGFNTYFSIRGLVDIDPGCSKELLPPGESVVCDKIGFDQERYGLAAGINRISAQVPGKTEALLVECSE